MNGNKVQTTSVPVVCNVRQKQMSSLSKFYLTAYNSIQTVGWSYVFFQTLKHVIAGRSAVGLWDSCGTCLLVFQTLALLEVVHCLLGLVPANPFLTFIQILSRVFQIWGVIYSVPEIQNAPTVALLTFAWSLTEIIRYSFYCSSLLGKQSALLTWCRYSFFLGLYPAGVSAEVGNVLQSLSVIKKKQLYSFTLPNPANISFSYYYLCILILLTYIPFFPKLYNHMRKQRAKALGTKKDL